MNNQVFHSGIEKQASFFNTLASLVKPKPEPQARTLGAILPMNMQGCYMLVRS